MNEEALYHLRSYLFATCYLLLATFAPKELGKDFKNKSFNNLASLQQAIFSAVNSLIPEKVASLTSYPFILDALSI